VTRDQRNTSNNTRDTALSSTVFTAGKSNDGKQCQKYYAKNLAKETKFGKLFFVIYKEKCFAALENSPSCPVRDQAPMFSLLIQNTLPHL
jgi:hypothetical protein